MRAFAGNAFRGPAVSAGLLVSAVALLAVAEVTPVSARGLEPILLVAAVVAAAHRRVLAWRNLLAALILLILFVPIRRYGMPGHLPFQLEPYRLFVALLLGAWGSSLLIDPRVRIRASGFEWPFFFVALSALASVVVNSGRVQELGVQSDVAKKLTFLFSFLLVVYLVASLVRTFEHVDFLLKMLVGGGAVLAVFAIIEARTGYNAFNHLSRFVPILKEQALPYTIAMGRGRLRAYASAEHPIALGAVLMLLVPLGIYLRRMTQQRRWLVATMVVALGALATLSRTGVVMLIVIGLVYLRLRPRETKRLWPLLVPALLVVHLAIPGTLGSLKAAFFPQGGLIAQQKGDANTRGSGRLADLGPGLHEWAKRPLFGEGYGTRVVDKDHQNAPILDDQWLGNLLETGLVGTLAWVWLFFGYVRRLGRRAREDLSPRGWLYAGLAASVCAYAVSMFTYDAFSFIQVTFVLYILVGLGGVVLRASEPDRPLAVVRRLR